MSNSTSRTCCQRCIVPLIAIILGLQLVFVWVLVWHHELFKVAFNDLSTLTTSSSQSSELTQQQRRGKEEEEDDDDDVEENEKGDQMRRGFRAVKKHARVSSRKVLQRKDEPYRTFPVKIISPHSTLHVPEASRAVLETMLGRKLVEVDFPDLSYRASAVIRSQHPRMFAELPAYGFDNSFRNPCWRREVENPTQNSSAGHLVCLPYAYVLGQPKCGTSDLFERMKEHPDIIMPRRKEVRWFTRGEFMTTAMAHEGEETRLPGDALSRSLDNEEGSPKDKITIDGGPHTLWWPTQSPDGSFLPNDIPPAQLIRELQPNTKFLLTLSNPVKRMYSDYYFLDDDLRPVHPGSELSKSAQQFHDRAVQQVEDFRKCVDAYMTILQPQFGTDFSFTPKYEIELDEKYKQQMPIWFRASQMCAHDRHRFAVGGWGRLAIGLYVLFLEKWFEHFNPNQFLVLRLESYEENPQGYLMDIFRFLQINQPNNWAKILTTKHFNEHRIQRQPILEDTENLLRSFYRPYNQLLVQMTNNPGFAWEVYKFRGIEAQSLRDIQLVERSETVGEEFEGEEGEDGREDSNANGHRIDSNRHGLGTMLHRHPDESQQEDGSVPKTIPGGLRGAQQQPRPVLEPIKLFPSTFDISDLPQPSKEEEADLAELKTLDLTNADIAGRKLCEAAFTMHIGKLKYLLHDAGVPADLANAADAGRNALHCLAGTYTLADAHSKSHVFAELKGKTTWVTKKLNPPLEAKIQSVLGRDVVEHLADATKIAASWLLKASVPVDAKDVGGHTPLHHASLGGNRVLVEILLANGADANVPNKEQRTPLHFAVAYGRADIAGMLIKVGADVKLEDLNHVSPYDMISNPGTIQPLDALRILGIKQRPVKTINRLIHPELHNNSKSPEHSLFSADGKQFLGWTGGKGGWRSDRLAGFEKDMACDGIDQYYQHEITGKEIFNNYIARNAPVLIRGLVGDWAAVQNFAADALVADHGTLGVQVSDIPYATKFGGAQSVDMTLADYIEEVRAHKMLGGKHPWYVFKGHPIPHGSESKDSLVSYNTCPTPESIQDAFLRACPKAAILDPYRNGDAKSRELYVNAQWALGGEGTGAPIHFHNTAWSALLYGAKKWIIYPPHNMIMSNKQILDFFEHDMEDFKGRGVTPLTCVQTAGDVMIIPESWGHGVLNIQESVALATEFKYSNWRIKPGISTISHIPAFENAPERKLNSAKRKSFVKPVN